MLITKKRRYKPLYKKFLNLKQNVQNRPRIFKFKKRKWKNLIEFLNRFQSKRPGKFKLYDFQRYPLLSFSFRNNFRYKLHTKQKVSYFYGGLSKKYLKKISMLALNRTKLKKKITNSKLFLIESLEKRLDVILHRSHFVMSIRSARQLISHGQVFVNKRRVNNCNFILKRGDLVEFSPMIHCLIEKNLKSSRGWPMPPKYLQINYRTFQVLIIEDIKSTSLSLQFPFWLDFSTLLKSYER